MNMFGNLGKMGEMIKQAKQLKDEMSRARYESEANGVKVVINGEMEIKELTIPEEMTDHRRIESSVKDAVNRGMKTAKEDMARKMSKLTGGMGGMLPGM
ncbi:MAG: YbaB/EbfC family nucleoid-associated protein [Candidatus Margulisbacteria bacterium]|nr:YbaB/EbfC family nucleoid-associated protein [Candidatus Margulisiibacteriota bacterium]